MAQLVFSTINSGYASTQAYLAHVRVCVGCKTQKPKETFKMFEGQELCADCREELQEEREDGSINR
jgi:recombinational DNA repair protein (RecF pathway)